MGGFQDRTVRFDSVVPPKATADTEAYCVEQGRSRPRDYRDYEAAQTFSGSPTTLPTARLKTTVIRGQAQDDVWSGITATQDTLTGTLGGRVRSSESPSSYPLTAESPRLKGAVSDYLKALRHLAETQDAVGAAIAINGALNRADLYATKALFRDLWPKLLEGAAVEAVAKSQDYDGAEPPTVDEVRSYLERSREGTGCQQETGPGTLTTTIVTDRTTFYETRILKPKDTWVHHGYVTETAEAVGSRVG
jgi:hypothetical protein